VLWTTFGLNPQDDVVRDDIDLVELNHLYDEHGKKLLDQVIYYEWCPQACRYQVRAWRLLKNQGQVPRRDWRTGEYSATWHDGDVLRHVRTAALRETWTQHDPELIEREFLPKDKRRDLRKPVSPHLDSSALVAKLEGPEANTTAQASAPGAAPR
jgi:hypothetical protein